MRFSMIIKRDELFRVVCEFLIGEKVGTGMFVSSPYNNEFSLGWIVTASHVAKETNDSAEIVISSDEGKAIPVPLKMFGNISEWRHHPIADISAFPIYKTPENDKFLFNRILPYEHLFLEEKTVSRDYELTAIGFPQGLGTEDYFSPLSFRSHASSGFITMPRADTKTLSTFFCLENPSVGGYSGCPVFDLGYETSGTSTVYRKRTWCYGIMHGTIYDDTGGKIAMVTPAFYLKDLLKI